MAKSLLEQLPSIVAAGKRQAAQILEQLEGQNKVSLQTRELVIPSKDKAGFNLWGSRADEETTTAPNRLIYGDNLLAIAALLAGDEHTPSMRGKVDLIYIDPPFDSKADYRTKITLPGVTLDQKPTVLEQFAYSDTWSDGTASYLAMISARLVLMRELLSNVGTIYVHLDYHVAHYVKLVLDEVFSRASFRNEIVWKRKGGSALGTMNRMSVNTDSIFVYTKTDEFIFNPVYVRNEEYINEMFRYSDDDGRRFMLNVMRSPSPRPNLQILEDKFKDADPGKHPKLLVICEDTTVSPHVEEFLKTAGLSEDDILRVDSGRKSELGAKDWEPVREKLFDVDKHTQPKVIISVLMLREGFDVSNICVIVPLRSSQASILLEQTIGRGLRLMWRGNDAIDELKAETRERMAKRMEPANYFDVLFVVEHPAFSDFYEELLNGGLAVEVGDENEKNTSATGDLEFVDLRPGYQAYDFEIPIIIRDADEELREPSINPLELPVSRFPLDLILKQVGKGDRFVSEDQQTGTQFGDYRVDGGVLTATGYNDYLSRMTTRVTEALGRNMTTSAKKYREISQFPILQSYRPLLLGWIDAYIRKRMFGAAFDPLAGENWRVLMLDDVAHELAGTFATTLVELQENQEVDSAIVQYRKLSDVATIPVRASSAAEVNKCIYERLPIPTKAGGLERTFIHWADGDSAIEALAKVHEYRHDFLRRPYLKADGMPAQYSPDFLVRTGDDIYVVETKAQSALSDENVKRKQRAALAWCEQINELPEEQRDGRLWHYVLLGETIVKDWKKKNARASELLDYARLRRSSTARQEKLL